MKVKEESEKVGFKLNIQKTKIMASSPTTSWQIDGETVKTGSDFIFMGSKITADGDCSHEIKRHLLLGRKLMTNLDSILKSRDITLSTSLSSQGYDFSTGHVWMWQLDYKESWVLKNWCFWTVVLEKTGVPWTARRSNQSILKEISPGCSLEGLMLKLKFQYLATWCEELAHLKKPWCWERMRAGGEGDDRGWDGWMASLTQWTWVWVDSGRWWWTGRPDVLWFMGSQSQTWLSHRSELNWFPLGWTGWISLQSKGLSRVFSNITVQKHQLFGTHLSLWPNTHIHTWLLEKS